MFSANACSYRRGLSPRIRRLISGRFGENRDVHNFMVYATTAVSVGVYDPNRLASMGLGHWAAYAGVGYTYLNEQVGFEWSAVVEFTYNFINPYTQYRSGMLGARRQVRRRAFAPDRTSSLSIRCSDRHRARGGCLFLI